MSRPLTELEKHIRTTKLEIIKNKEETDSPIDDKPLHELIKDLKKGLTAEFMYAFTEYSFHPCMMYLLSGPSIKMWLLGG